MLGVGSPIYLLVLAQDSGDFVLRISSSAEGIAFGVSEASISVVGKRSATFQFNEQNRYDVDVNAPWSMCKLNLFLSVSLPPTHPLHSGLSLPLVTLSLWWWKE